MDVYYKVNPKNWGVFIIGFTHIIPIFTTLLFLTGTVEYCWCPNKVGDGQSKFPPSSTGDRYPKNIRRDHRTIQSRWAEFTEISGHFGRDMKSVVGTRRIDGRVPFTICQHFPGFWHEVDTTSTRVCGWGGVGHVNVSCKLHTLLMFCTCQDVGQGLGWGGAC